MRFYARRLAHGRARPYRHGQREASGGFGRTRGPRESAVTHGRGQADKEGTSKNNAELLKHRHTVTDRST